jgi:glutamate racemase
MLDSNIDYLVLGCTHYPYLMPQLLEILPKHIKIIDSSEAVARQTQAVLRQHELLNNATNKPILKFYSNGNPDVLQSLLGNNYNAEYLAF